MQIKNLNKKKMVVIEKRKIILFIDNCEARNLTSTFNSIQGQFLPPNTTSVAIRPRHN